MSASSDDSVKTTVENCARCGTGHKDIKFAKLKRACASWTHWAICPETGEPIMLKVVDADKGKKTIRKKTLNVKDS